MMKRLIFVVVAIVLSVSAATAQTAGALNGYCNLGGANATVSGLAATNYQQGIIPGCTVTVYLTGTLTKATIYKDSNLTPQTNPFTANVSTSPNSGAWVFWAGLNQGYDVVASGGTAPNTYPQPVTVCTDCFPSEAVVVPPSLQVQTNATNNTSQTLLNFVNTNGVTWSNPSGGVEEVNVNVQALGGPPTYNSYCANDAAGNTVTCNLPSVTKGDILLVLGAVYNYGTSLPTAPTVTDSQGNLYTVDATQQNPYFGTGSANTAAHVFAGANGSITFTVAQTGCASCSSSIVVMDLYGLGVDVGALSPPCSIGCYSLSPSVAATTGNDVAFVLSTQPLSGTTASPGSPLFSYTTTSPYSTGWQFSAVNPGTATTTTINFGGGSNFPAAAIWLIKTSLQYNPGSGTVNPGGSNNCAMYAAATSNNLYPSGAICDAAGDVSLGGFLASKVSTVASSSSPTTSTMFTHITGTSTLQYLNVNPACDVTNSGCISVVIPDGNIKFTPAGGGSDGMGFSGAATAGQPVLLVYDHGTQKWLPIAPVGAAQTAVTGTTAGTAVWSQPQQTTTWKQAVVYLNGYENTTGTAQTITLPASFATVGYVVTDGGSCTGVTISGTTVTLPSSMGATQTGLCEIRGY